MRKRLNILSLVAFMLILVLALGMAACNVAVDDVDPISDDVALEVTDGNAPSFDDAKAVFEYADGVVALSAGEYEKNGSTIKVDSLGDIVIGSVLEVSLDNGKKEGYKVSKISSDGFRPVLTVVEASLEDVYSKIDVTGEYGLDIGNIEFISDEELQAQLDGSGFAAMLSEWFGAISVSKERLEVVGDMVYFDVKFSIPTGISNVTAEILLKNEAKVITGVNYSTIPFSFDLGADMSVKTTSIFSIKAADSISGQYDAEEVVAKLAELANYPINEEYLRIFSWSYPIGPLFISYDLDLKFAVGFSGELNVETVTVADYALGASYIDSEFKPYIEKKNTTSFDVVGANLLGKVNTQAGIVNTLSLKILQIAGVGLQLDLGAYLDVYGAVQFNVTNFEETAAGYYVDFGLYYDVNLVAGINILNIIDLTEKFNLAGGRLQLFDLGSRSMNVDFTNDINEILLVSNKTMVPTFYIKQYDLITRQFSVVEVDVADIDFIVLDETAGISVVDGVIVLSLLAGAEFNYSDILKLQLKDSNIAHYVTLVRESNIPYAIDSIKSFNKSTPAGGVAYNLDMRGGEFVGVSGNGITAGDYTFSNNVLTIDPNYLTKIANGVYQYDIETTAGDISVWTEVEGTVSLYTLGSGTLVNPYRLFTPEQIVNLSVNAAVNNYYNGLYFELTSDIDMRGINFTPISYFNGTLNGAGYSITNFTVNTTVNDTAGFIGINNGVVNDLTVSANVSVNAKVARVGILAGINNGTISNCTVSGSVNVQYKTNATNHSNLMVGGAVGINKGTITTLSAAGSVYVKSYGSSISSKANAAGVIGLNEGTVNGLVATNSVENDTVKWHTANTNILSNNK